MGDAEVNLAQTNTMNQRKGDHEGGGADGEDNVQSPVESTTPLHSPSRARLIPSMAAPMAPSWFRRSRKHADGLRADQAETGAAGTGQSDSFNDDEWDLPAFLRKGSYDHFGYHPLPHMTQTATVAAYGEPDDHLRMTVLIAGALAPHHREAAAVCQRAQANPWAARFDALSELLQTVELRRPGVVCRIRDLGALPESLPDRGKGRWDDRSSAREQAQLRGRLERSVEVGVLAVEGVPSSTGEVIDRVEPALRPLARWLRANRRIDDALIASCVGEGDSQYFLSAMWDAIGRDARVAALRLSALRPPQRLNGVFGPVSLRGGDGRVEGLSSVTRAAVDRLLEMGVLHRDAGGGVYFPQPVRAFLRVFATEYSPEELQQDHRTLAQQIVGGGPEALVERHYHAVQGRDLEGARATAAYYGSDLRTLARELSLEGDHAGAAKIYEEIVTTYDAKDAYAWEYLGYNLWQPHRRTPVSMPEALRHRIEDALTRACTVDRFNQRNPLFLGRLLGFRGMLGADISGPFADGVGRYARTLGVPGREEQSELSWFAKQVRTAFASSGAQARYLALCAAWQDKPRVHQVLTAPVPHVG